LKPGDFPDHHFIWSRNGEELRLDSTDIHGFRAFLSYANARAYGVTPINGGLFLGEDASDLQIAGLNLRNDHDQRNEGNCS
jgi:hypothetical protein